MASANRFAISFSFARAAIVSTGKNCLFLYTFVELFGNSNLFSQKLLYSLDYKSLSENLVIILSSSFSVLVFCLMVLSLWANEMFCRKSESANQLMLFINFFSEMSSNKILQQQQKKKNSLTILVHALACTIELWSTREVEA